MYSFSGNIVDDAVPVSKDEDADNLVVRKWGKPRFIIFFLIIDSYVNKSCEWFYFHNLLEILKDY